MEVGAPSSRGDDIKSDRQTAPAESSLAAALSRPVLATDRAVLEVRSYVRLRVPRVPAPESIAAWEAFSAKLRQDILDRVVFRGRAAEWRDASCDVQWLDTIPGGSGYTIRKLRFEALPGMW